MIFFSFIDKETNNKYLSQIKPLNQTYNILLGIEEELSKKENIFKNIEINQDDLFNSFFTCPEIKDRHSETNQTLSQFYFHTHQLYEELISFLTSLNTKDGKRLDDSPNLRIIEEWLENSSNEIEEITKTNIIKLIKFRNSISHTIFFKFYLFYILSNSNKKIFSENITYEKIEIKYKKFFNQLKPKDYEVLLTQEFIFIKDMIKKIKQNSISKTTFAEQVEIPIINIYQALTSIHHKMFKHTHIKKTIFENNNFNREDMNVLKFLHDFKHHTTHEHRRLSDQYQKFNLIKKLLPSPEYKRNKKRQKTHVNLITSIKELFHKFQNISKN